MKLFYKLMFGFLAVLLFFWIVGYFFISANKNELRELIAKDSETLVSETLDKIDIQIHNRYEVFQEYSKDSLLKEFISKSNQDFGKLDDIESSLNKRDKEWISTGKNEVPPVMHTLINNSLSKEIKEKIAFYEEHDGYKVFAEVIVTNKHGANVAQTGRTTSYRQDDKEWWQITKRDGFYARDIAYEKNLDIYSIVIGIRVVDEKGDFAGAMKIALNVEDVVKNLKKLDAGTLHAGHPSMAYYLITEEGKLIYSNQRDKEFLDDVSYLLPKPGHLLPGPGHNAVDSDSITMNRDVHTQAFVTHAHSEGHEEFKGLGWILILQHKAEEIFTPLTQLINKLIIASVVFTIFGVLVASFVSISITDNVKKLQSAISKIGGGNLDANIDVKSKDEIGQLASAFKKMTRDLKDTLVMRDKLSEEITEHKRLQQALEILSSFDELTGIGNRRQFDKTIDLEWRRAMRVDTPLALIMIDIDFFKEYNDLYGHVAGDECLKILAQTIKNSLRRPGDFVARYGGEEFAVTLPDTNANSAFILAESLRENIVQLNIIHEGSKISKNVTISLGVSSIIPETQKTIINFISSADEALYKAKREGRNRAVKA
jgi:diguanylate cyclase (GGDEF)-like protein